MIDAGELKKGITITLDGQLTRCWITSISKWEEAPRRSG